MFSRGRKIAIAAVAALTLVAFASPHHRADIEILTHRSGDVSPEKVQAVFDLGLVAISVLVTWSKRLAS